MKKVFVVLFIISSAAAMSRTIDVRLFSNYRITETWITTYNETFYLLALDKKGVIIDTVADIEEKKGTNRIYAKVTESKVSLVRGKESFGTFPYLMLVSANNQGHFIIKGKGRERIYTGGLMLKPSSTELYVINRVPLEDYVAGVVESEGGHHAQFEYFKAQAVLARTWVLKNMNKHSKDGYNVKDDVSSQAYYSKAYLQYSDNILQAVKETRDTVLVDANGKPIFGAFHSNSGGQTTNSEDAWSGRISYLRSIPDTFSLKMEKAYWTKTINKAEFLRYFASKLGQSASDPEFENAVVSFAQPERKAYFNYQGKSLKLRYVRHKFKLRSTFFSVSVEGENVVLHGRGFGHGVGMSQEGAMRMAELGYCYKDILKFYFSDVKLDKIKE